MQHITIINWTWLNLNYKHLLLDYHFLQSVHCLNAAKWTVATWSVAIWSVAIRSVAIWSVAKSNTGQVNNLHFLTTWITLGIVPTRSVQFLITLINYPIPYIGTIDESMIPIMAKHNTKQLIRGKLISVCFKCSKFGFFHCFNLYLVNDVAVGREL